MSGPAPATAGRHASRPPLRWLPRRRVALGVAEHAAPSLLFVVVGIVLGPEALNLVSGTVLAQLDPVISVALAVLGVFIASGYASARGPRALIWLAGSTVEALVTLASVGGAMYLLLGSWQPPMPVGAADAAWVLGMCATASAALHLGAAESDDVVIAAHVADLDDLPLVVFSGIAVPLLARTSSAATALALGLGAGVVIGAAGALLFRRASSPAERGVFVTGTIVLLGGAAAYGSASSLATGCMAGLIWARTWRFTANLVESDLWKLQHPLVAVLLVIAGASIQFSSTLLWIGAPLVLFRLTGKLLGSLVAARVVRVPAGLLGTILAPPGVLGIALALNVQQVLASGDTVLVSAVTVATVVSELLAIVLLPREDLG